MGYTERTGEVIVRFKKVPKDADLKAFAKKHDLVILERNRFNKRHIKFHPQLFSTDLDALTAAINLIPEVETAWAATLSLYSRF